MPRRPSRRRRVFAVEPLEERQMMNADSRVLDLLFYDSWRNRAATISEATIVPPPAAASSAMPYDLWRGQTFSLGEITPQETGFLADSGASNDELGTYDAQAWNLIRLNEVRSNYSYTGTGYAVAVIDTGIDYNHPALGGGWGNRVIAGWDFVNNDSNPMDDNGHGTHVAGIIGSSNSTYAGVAPNVNLIALKVLGTDGSGNFGAVEDALRWVINNQAQYNIVAVNMSLGAGNFATNPYTFLEDEFATLTSQGVFIAAASGNSYYSYGSQQGLGYPAISGFTVSVGAVYDANLGSVTWSSGARDYTTAADRITSFTQRSSGLDILAPGAMITSTGRNNTFVTMAGTSMATPVVAGAAAILHQALDARGLGAAAFQSYIVTLMKMTGASVVDGDDENDNVTNTGLTFKRLDLYAALNSIAQSANRAPTLSPIANQSLSAGQTTSIALSAVDADNDPISFSTRVIASANGDVPGTATISGQNLTLTVSSAYAGTFTVEVTASDGVASSTRSFQVTVSGTTVNYPFSSDFNQADSGLLGSWWLERIGNLMIANNRVVGATGQNSLATLQIAAARDVAIQAQLDATAAGSSSGLIARYSGPGESNFYMAQLANRGAGGYRVELWRNVSGTWTMLGVQSVGVSQGTLRFELIGSSLTVAFNGSLSIRVVDTAITVAGGLGLRAFSSATFDDFSAALATSTTASTPFTDAFSRTSAYTMGSNWADYAGFFSLNGQSATSANSMTSLSSLNSAGLTDVSVRAQVELKTAGASAGLLARQMGEGESNFYMAQLADRGAAGYRVEIWRNLNGTWALLASGQATSNGGELRFDVLGDRLTVFLNDEAKASVTDRSLTGSGRVGIRSWSGVDYQQFSVKSPTADPASILPLSDSFNRPDTTRIGAGWIEWTGNLLVSGNRMQGQTGVSSIATIDEVLVSNVSLQANVDVTEPGTSAGLIARYNGPNETNFYMAHLAQRGAAYRVEIWRNLGGNWSMLGSQDVNAASGLLRFDATGTTLTAYFNGQTAVSLEDSAITGAGYAGVRVWSNASIDNFVAAQPSTPSTTLPFQDSFPTAGTLSSNWLARLGSINVAGGKATGVTGASSVATLSGVSVSNSDTQIDVDVTASGSSAGLLARYSGPGESNFYMAQWVNRGTFYRVEIWRNVGGTWSLLSSQNVATGIGTMRFTVIGSTLTAYANGQIATRVNDNSLTAAGAVGIRLYSGSSIDNYSAS